MLFSYSRCRDVEKSLSDNWQFSRLRTWMTTVVLKSCWSRKALLFINKWREISILWLCSKEPFISALRRHRVTHRNTGRQTPWNVMSEHHHSPASPSSSSSSSVSLWSCQKNLNNSLKKDLFLTQKKYPDQVPSTVKNLIISTQHLQEVLRLWSVGKASEGDVSDTYVQIGNELNLTISAFAQHQIDLR